MGDLISMYKLEYETTNNVPVFKCNFCGKCTGVLESTSFASNKNRGCCWYFPKYTLTDIKNILDFGQKSFIYKLLNMKNSKVGQFHIDVRGEFSEEKYLEYLRERPDDENVDFDPKLFFRLCPFSTPKGCMIDFQLRPHPCNLYLCRSVLDMCEDECKPYAEERTAYFAYCNYFNETLKYELLENKCDLSRDPFRSLEVLEKFQLPPFEHSKLHSIKFGGNGQSPVAS